MPINLQLIGRLIANGRWWASLRCNKKTTHASNFTFFRISITLLQELDGCSQTVCLMSTPFLRRRSMNYRFFCDDAKKSTIHGHPSKERDAHQTNRLTTTIQFLRQGNRNSKERKV